MATTVLHLIALMVSLAVLNAQITSLNDDLSKVLKNLPLNPKSVEVRNLRENPLINTKPQQQAVLDQTFSGVFSKRKDGKGLDMHAGIDKQPYKEKYLTSEEFEITKREANPQNNPYQPGSYAYEYYNRNFDSRLNFQQNFQQDYHENIEQDQPNLLTNNQIQSKPSTLNQYPDMIQPEENVISGVKTKWRYLPRTSYPWLGGYGIKSPPVIGHYYNPHYSNPHYSPDYPIGQYPPNLPLPSYRIGQIPLTTPAPLVYPPISSIYPTPPRYSERVWNLLTKLGLLSQY